MRDVDAALLGASDRRFVACVRVAEHAHPGVRCEHALEAARGLVGPVGDHHHASVNRVPDAHATAMTQDAPLAVLTSALRSGQSAIASEPSFIASVSRKGDATEPQSRWSRPMTIGAFTLPLRTSSLKARPALARSP